MTRFFYNFNERHPEKPNNTALDYGLAAVMMPLTLIGTQVGAFLYLICPVLIINVILTLLLIYLWIKSMVSAVTMYNKEKSVLNNQVHAIPNPLSQISSRSINDKEIDITEAETENKEIEMVSNNDSARRISDSSGAQDQGKDEYGLPVVLTGTPEGDEVSSLRTIIRQEKSHC